MLQKVLIDWFAEDLRTRYLERRLTGKYDPFD